MSRIFPPALLALIIGVAITGNASAATYYIAANGSDSNNGTSQSTPWAHLPGMATWTGSHAPTAGDTFILRGCDVWANSNFPVLWSWSGSSSNPITIDRDTTWYNTANCPNSWNRPIFNAGSAVMGGAECSGNNIFILFAGIRYVDWNWIELTGYYNNNGSCWGKERLISGGTNSDFDTFTNFYVHNMTAGGSSQDIDNMISADPNNCLHCLVDYMVMDNSDGTRYTSGGITFPLQHSICAYVSNCIKPATGGEYAYNDILHVGSVIAGVHANCIETIGGSSPTYYIHDNRIHDMTTGSEHCEGLQVGNPGETDYVWNNIWYNMTSTGANGPQLPQNCSTGVTAMYLWNNTIGDVSTGVGFRLANSCGSFGIFDIRNNHAINYSASVINLTPTATAYTNSNNLGQTATQADANSSPHFDQYTESQTFVNSPVVSTNSTAGAGANLASVWPGGFSTSDTTYACVEQTVNTVIQSVCNQRAAAARPGSGSGAWDVGAYELSSSSSGPNAPTGLSAVVQ